VSTANIVTQLPEAAVLTVAKWIGHCSPESNRANQPLTCFGDLHIFTLFCVNSSTIGGGDSNMIAEGP
jgi:hypothetical protein